MDCAHCHRLGVPVKARGLCGRCYTIASQAGTLPPRKIREPQPKTWTHVGGPVHWHLLSNAPGPELPAREPGEDEASYRRRLNGFTEVWSGRRARPHRRTRIKALDVHHGGER